MRNIAHMKKLNGCPETSQGQTMTSIPVGNRDGERESTVSIPVNVGTSDEERDLTVSNPVTVESSGGECASCTNHACCSANPAPASSKSTVVDERLCEINEQFTKQSNNLIDNNYLCNC